MSKIFTDEELAIKKEEAKKMFASCTNNELLDLFNTYSMAYAIHEKDEKAQTTDFIACETLWEIILGKMR